MNPLDLHRSKPMPACAAERTTASFVRPPPTKARAGARAWKCPKHLSRACRNICATAPVSARTAWKNSSANANLSAVPFAPVPRPRTRVHAHRTARRHRHHRDSRGDAAAGLEQRQIVRATRRLCEQPAPAWHRHAIVLGRKFRELFSAGSTTRPTAGTIYWFGWLQSDTAAEGQRAVRFVPRRFVSVSQRQRRAALPDACMDAGAIQAQGRRRDFQLRLQFFSFRARTNCR